ncbi:hypothetical protein H1P_1150024 [Hyella patelloides LEGE 07179]|uniref:Uncharacterized protein n=1 Tax=Hyella patelloides LEGE 07179 TaxID=945734 RepID=A0A563VJU5_9CYAN|nr:hypothetical protein H1P_1150024 [Hyella patelloides LEGE 07179]
MLLRANTIAKLTDCPKLDEEEVFMVYSLSNWRQFCINLV